MELVGLTGGTGSGKTEAARHFASLGFPVIDADAIGHALIAPGGALESAVVEAFGADVVTDGRVDRKKLGALVFRDAEQRKRLNALVHPAIRLAVANQCATLAEKGHRIAILDAALLAEHGTRDNYLSALVLILASKDIRKERLVRYRSMSEAAATMQIEAQTPPEHKRGAADWVIVNEGTRDSLHRQVEQVADALKLRYAAGSDADRVDRDPNPL